jgi:hypothetical protein
LRSLQMPRIEQPMFHLTSVSSFLTSKQLLPPLPKTLGSTFFSFSTRQGVSWA